MQNTFNTLINSFIDNKIGIADDFLSESLSVHLKENLITLQLGRQLKPAGTGDSANVDHTNLFRGDRIYWLDRKNQDTYENSFLDLMDVFVKYLNDTCYTGITSYEFHYTLYEEGSSYKKHLDQFRDNDNRKYSMVLYLNTNWKEMDGGELCIHFADRIQHISPTAGKTVFFKSNELEHEVLVTNKPRMSITGWLKC